MRALLTVSLIFLAATPRAAFSRQVPSSVRLSIAALDTVCYPSCEHPTEWKATLVAEVVDSAGTAIPPDPGMQYEWGADFCGGRGLEWGFSSGADRWTIDIDGNMAKSSEGCCASCPYQSYYVAVRVTAGNTLVTSGLLRVPDGGVEWRSEHPSLAPNPFQLTSSGILTLSLPLRDPAVQVTLLSLTGDLVFRREYSMMEYYGRTIVQIPASDFADQVGSGVHFVVATSASDQFVLKVVFLRR